MGLESPGKKIAAPNEDRPENYGKSDTQIFQEDSGLRRSTETVDMGVLGGSKQIYTYRPTTREDPNYAANRAAVLAQMGQKSTPTIINQSASNQARKLALESRGQQANLASMLRGMADGTSGPSAAMGMLNNGTNRSLAAALSMAKSARVNPAVAMRTAMGQNAMTMQGASNDAAMLRAQEQQQAQQTLASVLSGMRTGDANQQATDFNVANAQAGFTQGDNQFESERQRQLLGGLMGYDMQQVGNKISQEQFMADLLARQEAAKLGVAMQVGAQNGQLLGAGAQGLSALGGTILEANSKKANSKK